MRSYKRKEVTYFRGRWSPYILANIHCFSPILFRQPPTNVISLRMLDHYKVFIPQKGSLTVFYKSRVQCSVAPRIKTIGSEYMCDFENGPKGPMTVKEDC